MRTEPCVCGGLIVVPEEHSPAPYVEAHGLLPGHQVWRARKEGWFDHRRERPTADRPCRDVSGGDVRASAAAVEGRP